jgi:hypothetical protein
VSRVCNSVENIFHVARPINTSIDLVLRPHDATINLKIVFFGDLHDDLVF